MKRYQFSIVWLITIVFLSGSVLAQGYWDRDQKNIQVVIGGQRYSWQADSDVLFWEISNGWKGRGYSNSVSNSNIDYISVEASFVVNDELVGSGLDEGYDCYAVGLIWSTLRQEFWSASQHANHEFEQNGTRWYPSTEAKVFAACPSD